MQGDGDNEFGYRHAGLEVVPETKVGKNETSRKAQPLFNLMLVI